MSESASVGGPFYKFKYATEKCWDVVIFFLLPQLINNEAS